jgi:hypothetical protein
VLGSEHRPLGGKLGVAAGVGHGGLSGPTVVRTAVSLVCSATSAVQLATTSVRRSPAHELPREQNYSQHIWRVLVTVEKRSSTIFVNHKQGS